MRHTAIPIVGEVPWGTHFCQFYQNERDLIDILVPYLKAGLEANEFCMWVTAEPLSAEDAKDALARSIRNLDDYLSRGQIEILDYGQWYTMSGKFDSDRVLQGWVEKLKQAQKRGFDGLRLTGNTFWLEKSDWQDFTDYEAAVDRIIGQYPMLALCTYSLAKCGATEVMDVVSNHAFALIKRGGKWQVIESAERKRLGASLDRLNRELKERTGEDAERLASLNRTLRAHNRSNQALLMATDENAYQQEVCRVIVEECGHAMVWVGFREDDEAKTVRPVTHCGLEDGYLETLSLTWADTPRGQGPTGTAIRTGKVCTCRNMLTDPQFLPWREQALRRGYASSIALPLTSGGEVFGALTIYSRDPDPFSEDEIKLLRALATDFAYGIGVLRLRAAHALAEQALHESEERYRSLVEMSPDAVFVNHENRIVQINGAALRLLRAEDPDQVLGKSPFEVFHEDHHANMRGRIQRVLSGGAVPLVEEKVVRLDGTICEVEVAASRCREQHGFAVQVILRDITGRKAAEEELRRHREWLRVTLSSIGDAVLATDTKGKVTFLNPVAVELTGWTEGQALGLPVQDVFRIINEYTRERAEDIVGRVLREGHVVSLANHTLLITHDGREIPIEDSAAPIRDVSGNVAGVVLVFHDVTEKRRAEEALQHAEQRVRLTLESILSPEGDIGQLELGDIIDTRAIQLLMDDFYHLAHMPMAIIDLQGKVPVGVGWQDICTKFHRVHPDTCRHCIESDTQLTAGIAPGEFKLYKCKNSMWDIATPLIVGGEHVGHIFSGQFFFENEPVDRELFRSQSKQYGFKEEEYLAALDAVPRLSPETVQTGMEFLMKLGHMLSKMSYSNIKLARSLAERDNLMSSLQASASRLNRSQEIAHLGSWEWDALHDELSWSDEVYRIFGFQPQEFSASHNALLEAVHPDDRAAVEAAYWGSLREGRPTYEITHRILRKATGEIRWVNLKCEHIQDASGRIIRSAGMLQDITESKRTEERLRESQKLESIGMLAGGIAHDFNNLLVGIIGNSSLLAEMLPNQSPEREIVKTIEKTGEQAAHLTRQMLAYAGKGRFLLEPVNLSRLVRQTGALIDSSISKKITIDLKLTQNIPHVESDPSQMQQVFMNLALNAAEAIGDHPGVISIATGAMSLDAAYIRNNLEGWDIETGPYVFLEVRDTGCGMNAATKARIFDPFFTTKFTGRGLGLAAVAGIVRSHKGAIEVTTAPGRGTAFRVLFPALATGAAASAPILLDTKELGGAGTVLFVDDEKIVRDLAKCSLERRGYEVLLAESGMEAIDLVRLHGNRIGLVVLDVSMPEMGGEETLPHLRKFKPDLKVLVSSGHSEAEALRQFDGARLSGFIQKPYRIQDLASKVKSALA